MARPTLTLQIALENIHCHDEGDGTGNAEPYLWPVFFKIDGDSFAVESSGLIGFPIIESRNGHHRNMGHLSVDEGDNVPVPEDLGTWQTTLKPIPVNDPTFKLVLGDDLPGIAGVVVVLMEEDGWSDDLANTGYAALVNSVQLAVARVAAGFQHATSAPTKEKIDAAIATVKNTASAMVHDAVKGSMSGWELFWFGTIGNNDDTIGSEAWTVNHDDLARDAFIDFSRRWSGDDSGDGDWSISGSFIGIAPCPAEALLSLSSTHDQRLSTKTLTAMRTFRSGEYRNLPGLALWWRALEGGVPDVVRMASRHPDMHAAIGRLFAALPGVLEAADHPIGADQWNDLRTVFDIASKSGSFLPRAIARRGLRVLPEIEGRSWNAAVRRVANVRPRGRKRC